MGKRKPALTALVRVLPDGALMTIRGRDAWAIHQLYLAGAAGCTPIDQPGPRWSGYVFKLRKLGIVIETVTEGHAGQFSGHHARYILRSPISLVVKDRDEAGREAA